MGRAKSGKASHVFKCETRFRYDKDDCVPVGINEDILKGIILEALREKAALFSVSEPAAKAQAVKEPSELSGVRAELSRVTGFLKGLYESLVSGDVTQAEYADMKQSYEIRTVDLAERERVLTEAARERKLNQIAADKASGNLGAISAAADLTAETIDALIDRILVFEDKRVEIHFKFTDEIAVAGGHDK
jgi:hypothetical protein